MDRGRGDALLEFTDDKYLDDATFKETDLKNKYLNPEDLTDMGITPITPDPDPGKFSPGTMRNFNAQSGSSVSRSKISPGQKSVVSSYFSE